MNPLGGPIPYFGQWEGAQWGCARCSGCGLGEHRCDGDAMLEVSVGVVGRCHVRCQALTVEYVDWKTLYVPPWSNTTQEFLFRQYWNDTSMNGCLSLQPLPLISEVSRAPGALKTFRSRGPSLVWANTGLHEPRVITFEKNATDALEYEAGTKRQEDLPFVCREEGFRYMMESLKGGRQLIWALTTAVKRGDQPKDWKDVTSSYRIWLLNQHALHAAQEVIRHGGPL